MDRFSRTWLGMSSKFGQLETDNLPAQEQAMAVFSQCDLMIGVTAALSFEADRKFPEALAAVAEAVAGLIFTGEALVAPDGRLVLSLAGESEL